MTTRRCLTPATWHESRQHRQARAAQPADHPVGNPGPGRPHRIPQAFDTRPVCQFLGPDGAVLNEPDELMIDWGDTPPESKAQIYWPEVPATDVLALASRLYGTNLLTAVDSEHDCAEPRSKGSATFRYRRRRQHFCRAVHGRSAIGVRRDRNSTSGAPVVDTDSDADHHSKARSRSGAEGRSEGAAAADATPKTWRYVTGAFQVKIPVTTEECSCWVRRRIPWRS